MFLGNFLDVFDKWLNRWHGGLYKEKITHVWQKKALYWRGVGAKGSEI